MKSTRIDYITLRILCAQYRENCLWLCYIMLFFGDIFGFSLHEISNQNSTLISTVSCLGDILESGLFSTSEPIFPGLFRSRNIFGMHYENCDALKFNDKLVKRLKWKLSKFAGQKFSVKAFEMFYPGLKMSLSLFLCVYVRNLKTNCFHNVVWNSSGCSFRQWAG